MMQTHLNMEAQPWKLQAEWVMMGYTQALMKKE